MLSRYNSKPSFYNLQMLIPIVYGSYQDRPAYVIDINMMLYTVLLCLWIKTLAEEKIGPWSQSYFGGCYFRFKRARPKHSTMCCDTGQNDTIGKIELNPTFVLSHKSANSRNDIQ